VAELLGLLVLDVDLLHPQGADDPAGRGHLDHLVVGVVPDDRQGVAQVDDPQPLPLGAGAARQGVDRGEVGRVVQAEVPDGVGRHRVAEHVDAGGVHVHAPGDVLQRLHHHVHPGEARAVQLAEV
jgi:hypothetical protein